MRVEELHMLRKKQGEEVKDIRSYIGGKVCIGMDSETLPW
jgi:hypothetical protein